MTDNTPTVDATPAAPDADAPTAVTPPAVPVTVAPTNAAAIITPVVVPAPTPSAVRLGSRIPAAAVHKALKNLVVEEVENVPEIMYNGLPVWKVTTQGMLKKRYITIPKEKYAIFITHSPLAQPPPVPPPEMIDNTHDTNNIAPHFHLVKELPIPFISRKGISGVTPNVRDRYTRHIDVADINYVTKGIIGSQKLENCRQRKSSSNQGDSNNGGIDSMVEQIVTIGHHGDQTLDIVIPGSEQQRYEFYHCIVAMQRAYQQSKNIVSHDSLLLRYIWYDVDTDSTGTISAQEFEHICQRINVHLKNNNPKVLYETYCKDHNIENGTLVFADIMSILYTIKNTNGIQSIEDGKNTQTSMANQIWNEIFGPNCDEVEITHFVTKFVHQIQKDIYLSVSDVGTIMDGFHDHNTQHQQQSTATKLVTRPQFDAYLYHDCNDAYNLAAITTNPTVVQPLTEPLSNYWVNSSHNTYLTGDQLKSPSSVEMYGKALRRGCKCVELDCWDGPKIPGGSNNDNNNGDNNNITEDVYVPVVYHGYTLTSKVLFEDCIKVIQHYLLDHPDTYPIILSIENHCSHPYQLAMTKIMKECFGERLYEPPSDGSSGAVLPSPESLRGKVIIQGKLPDDPEETDKPDSNDKEKDIPAAPPQDAKELARVTLFNGTKTVRDFAKKSTIIDEPVSDLYNVGETHVSTILSKIRNKSHLLWRSYNVNHMTRIYPGGLRIDSSNLNPILPWSTGCQIVSMNIQTFDTPLILNDGLFRQNDNCGYVLKPKDLIAVTGIDLDDTTQQDETNETPPQVDEEVINTDSLPFDEKEDGSTTVAAGVVTTPASATIKSSSPSSNNPTPCFVKVRILGGSCLPKPDGAKSGETVDPYVKITLHDTEVVNPDNDKDDTLGGTLTYKSTIHETKVVHNNGYCPVWNEIQPTTFTVYTPDVAVLQFSVRESNTIGFDQHVGGEAAIPITKLRTGYRSIQLYDKNNTRSGWYSTASVLVEIIIEHELIQ